MKKLVALLLAALMVLSSMAVLAEEATSPVLDITVDPEGIVELEPVEDHDEFADWEPTSDDVLTAIEGKEIAEQVVILPGEWEEGDVELTFTFPTAFSQDEELAVVLAVGENEYLLEYVVNEDTSVTIKIPAAVMQELVDEGAGLLTIYSDNVEAEEAEVEAPAEEEETEEPAEEETEEPAEEEEAAE